MRQSIGRQFTESIVLAGFLLVVGLCMTGCNRESDRPAETDEQSAYQQASDFRHRVEVVLNDADRRIQQLTDTIDAGGEEAQEAMNQVLRDLRWYRATLRQDLQHLERMGEPHVAQLRATVRMRMNAMQRDLEVVRLQGLESGVAFESAVASHVDEIDQSLARLARKAQEVQGSAPDRYQKQIDNLQVRREALKERLDTLRTASETRFEALRAEVAPEVATLRADVWHLATAMQPDDLEVELAVQRPDSS